MQLIMKMCNKNTSFGLKTNTMFTFCNFIYYIHLLISILCNDFFFNIYIYNLAALENIKLLECNWESVLNCIS